MNGTQKVFVGLARRYLSRAPTAAPVDLRGRVAIVTGASAGSIGYETAKQLAVWGARVAVSTRSDPEASVSRLQAELAKAGARAEVAGHALDLAAAASVDAFVRWHRQRFDDRLDILINNAGIHLDLARAWRAPRLTRDGFELHWRTNYLGTLHLTSRLLPSLLRTAAPCRPARVVFVASHLHDLGRNAEFFEPARPYDSWNAYGQSKLALIHAAYELERRYAPRQVHGYALHPGSVATNIALRGLEGTPRLQRLVRWLNPLQQLFLLTAAEGAQTQLHCASAPGLPGGHYYERCAPVRPNVACEDTRAAGALWDHTQRWIASLAAPEPIGSEEQSTTPETPA